MDNKEKHASIGKGKDSWKLISKTERCRLVKCPAYGTNNPECKRCTGPVKWKDGKGCEHGEARSCHSCPNNGLGLPVCWHSCPGPATGFQTDGKSIVTLGALEDQDAFLAQEALATSLTPVTDGDSVISGIEDDEEDPDAPRRKYEQTLTTSLTSEAETACRLLLSSMLSVDPMEFLILYYILQGVGSEGAAKSITENILHKSRNALRRTISRQAINKRLHQMAREYSFIRVFVPNDILDDIEKRDKYSSCNGSDSQNNTEARRRKHRITVGISQPDLFNSSEMIDVITASRRANEKRKRSIAEIKLGKVPVVG